MGFITSCSLSQNVSNANFAPKSPPDPISCSQPTTQPSHYRVFLARGPDGGHGGGDRVVGPSGELLASTASLLLPAGLDACLGIELQATPALCPSPSTPARSRPSGASTHF